MGLTENPKGQSEKANTIQIVDPEVYADGITKTYIEKNISSEKGIVKYNQWKQLSEGQYDEIIWSQITKLLENQEYFTKLSDDQKAALKWKINHSQFHRLLALHVGSQVESQRTIVFSSIEKMYDLTDEEKTEVTEMLSLLEQNELSLFGTKTTAIEKIMIEKFGEKIVNKKKLKKQSFELLADELNINPEELKTNLSLREALIQILAKQDVSLEGLRALLEKITSPEKKKILLQTFCPSFRLNELLNKGLVTKDSADKIIVDFLRKNAPKLDLGTLDGDKKDQLFIEIRKNIDLPVSALFDDPNVVSILFKEANFIDLLNHINSFQQSARSDMKIGQAKSLEDLMVVLQNDINLRSKENPLQCKLENAENLRDNSVVKIAHKNEKGEDYVFLVWIRSIGNDGTMVVQNIATEGGYRKRDDSWNEVCRFSDFYNLIESANYSCVLWEIKNGNNYEELEKSTGIKEMKEANDITTYDELFRKLNTIDPEGEKYDISKKGEEFFLEYGEGENLGVFRVCHKNGIMEVTNAEGTTEKLSYAQFYHAFEEKKCSRIAKITNTTSLLSSLSGLHKGGDEYAKLLIDKTKNGDNFIALEQKDIKENDRIITSDFINGKWVGYRIREIKDDKVHLCSLSIGDPEKKKDKETASKDKKKEPEKEDKTEYVSSDFVLPLHALYQIIKSEKLTPRPPQKIDQKKYEELDSHRTFMGTITRFLSHQSYASIAQGLKHYPEFLKEKMKSDSHILASEFALWFAKSLHLPEDMIIELRERVEAADKKKIEEKTDALMRLSAPVRQKLIISYLHDKAYDPRNGKPHYMILAAAQAMLKKHGSLYIGDLFPYRAKRAFFTKMGGTKQIWDAFVQNNALDPGVPETEEHILYKYTQCYNRNETKPDKKTGLIFTKRFPDNYWVQGLRSGWQSGTDEERNSGDKWTKTMTDADGIRDYMIGKFKGGEYSHGLGCIKNYYGKCSNSLDGNSIPFIVAMSDMPSVVFNQNLNELNNTFWSGFPYPGLAFIANPGWVEIFRKTVEQIVDDSGNATMKEDYGKITTLRAEGKKEHIDEILSFWKKYGNYINPILLITPDPSMMIERKKDENATYGKYYSSLKGYLKVPQLQTINESVVSNGLAEHNASSYFEARPETLFQMLKLKHMGELDNDKDVTHLFKFTLLEKLKSIKHLKVLGKDGKEDVDATKILRKENYKKWHIAVTKWLCNNATQNFSQGSKQPHVRKIARVFGYTYPDEQYSFQDDKNGDVNVHALPAGYLRQIDHDFEAYMSAGDVDINNLHRDMITERKAITENKVSDILQFVRGAQPVQKKKKQKQDYTQAA